MKALSGQWIAVALVASVALAARAGADDFFNITATGSGGTVVTDNSGNIIHITNDLINLSGEFFPLNGQHVSSALSWGGVPNAIVISENAAGTQATLAFPTTGFQQTFNGANPGD